MPTSPAHLPSALHGLHQAATDSRDTPWTDNEIRMIAGPLMHQDIQQWRGPVVFARLDLLALRSALPGDRPKDIENFLDKADEFHVQISCAAPVAKTRSITADELLPYTRTKLKRYNRRYAEELATVLSDVAGIDFRNSSSQEARTKWLNFEGQWDKYCLDHPHLMSLVRTSPAVGHSLETRWIQSMLLRDSLFSQTAVSIQSLHSHNGLYHWQYLHPTQMAYLSTAVRTLGRFPTDTRRIIGVAP